MKSAGVDQCLPFNFICLSRFAEQNKKGGVTCPQRRCFAACSGFHDIGPAPRNPQFILNLLAFVGAGPYIIISKYFVFINWLRPNSSHPTK